MKFTAILQNAYLALRQNTRRSILTMIGIIIGITAVITILSLGNGFKAYTLKSLTQSDSKSVEVEIDYTPSNQTGNFNFFNQTDLRTTEAVSGVMSAQFKSSEQPYIYQNFSVGKNTQTPRQVALTDGASKESIIQGRNLTVADNNNHALVAIVSQAMASEISDNQNAVIGYGLEIDNELYNIVGIFPGGTASSSNQMQMNGSTDVEIPKKTYDFLHSQTNTVTALKVEVAKGFKPSVVANNVVQKLTDSGSMTLLGTYSTTDNSAILDGIGQVLSMLTLFVSGIAGISLFIAGVGVMNMMYTSVSERTQEIGVRRAMGARKSDIRRQFLAEGLLLTVTSGIIGYILGFLLALLISQFLPFRVAPDLMTIALSLGITTLLGLVFSVAPANAAARKDLVEILR